MNPESNLPPGVTENMIPGNRPEDQEIELCLILSVGEIEDLERELKNQMDKPTDQRSPVWYVLENILEEIKNQVRP